MLLDSVNSHYILAETKYCRCYSLCSYILNFSECQTVTVFGSFKMRMAIIGNTDKEMKMRCEQEPAVFKISKEVQFEERQEGYLFFPVSVI